MDGDNAARQSVERRAPQSRLRDHVPKLLGLGELSDRFDEISIRMRVAGNDLAELGHDTKRKLVVDSLDQRKVDLRKFQAQEAAALLQYTSRFTKRDRYDPMPMANR